MDGAIAIAGEFLRAYGAKLVSNRAELVSFYTEASRMSFEGETFSGLAAIGGKLASVALPADAAYEVVTMDVQPSAVDGGIIVFVTGLIAQAQFQQVVQLAPLGAGGFYIHNDIFRVTAERPINAPAEWDGAGMQEFVTQFYRTFDGPRAEIAPLYTAASMLTYERSQDMGSAAIMERYASFPAMRHDLSTLDVQPVADLNVVVLFVTGWVQVEGSDNKMKFAETFQLVKTEGGGYYLHNDIYRLNLL